jgi:hypothetical protein
VLRSLGGLKDSFVSRYAGTAALLTVFDMQLDAGETHLLSPRD